MFNPGGLGCHIKLECLWVSYCIKLHWIPEVDMFQSSLGLLALMERSRISELNGLHILKVSSVQSSQIFYYRDLYTIVWSLTAGKWCASHVKPLPRNILVTISLSRTDKMFGGSYVLQWCCSNDDSTTCSSLFTKTAGNSNSAFYCYNYFNILRAEDF